MNYDAMGNYYGLVNDMLREPDTEANVKPVTQTITTDPVTGEQMMTVKGRPQDLSVANPNTPTVSQPRFNFGAGQPPAATTPVPAPVAPDQTYQRMIQAESGGRQFAPDGQVLTSPKGAMGVGQVMPSTAMQPGYGVPSIFDMAQQRGMTVPARDQATAQQLLGNEGLNRDFGQAYFNAMQQRFPGQPAASVAAYNAGPGRVGQNMQANAGQLNVGQLPPETQAYLQRVQPGAAPAQSVAPVAPTAPRSPMIAGGTTATDVLPTSTEQAVSQMNRPAPGATPVTAPTTEPLTGTAATLPSLQAQPYVDQFLAAQSDPELMSKLAYDKNVPDYIKRAASSQQYEQLRYQRETEETKKTVTEAIQNNDGRTLAKLLTDRKEEGSIAKAFLYSLIGFQSGAEAEVNKMGLKATWQQTVNPTTGEQALIKFAKDGLPIEGFDASGKPITGNALAAYAGAGAGKSDYVGGSVVNDRTGQIGRIVSRNNSTYVESGGKLYPATTAWRNNTVGTDLALAAKRALIDMEGKSATDALSYIRKWNAEHPDARIPEDVNGIAQLRNIAGGGGIVAPGATGTQATAAGGAATTPTTVAGGAPGAPAVAANPTVEKAKEIGRQDIVKKAADVVANEANIIKSLESADRNIKILESGKTNFGTVISGMIPGERAVGEMFKTADAVNTKNVMEYINSISAGNAKTLGANPTDRDLIFLTANVPNETWSDKDVADWIRRSEKAQRRTIEIARKQVESGGRYVPELPKESEETLSPAEKARQELEKRRNKK
jgi:hypothetical protein